MDKWRKLGLNSFEPALVSLVLLPLRSALQILFIFFLLKCLPFKLTLIDLFHIWRALMVPLLVFEVTLYEVENGEHSQGKQEKLVCCQVSLLLRCCMMLDPNVVLIYDHFHLGHFVEKVSHACCSDDHQQHIGLAMTLIYLASHLIVLAN